jgi:Na+-driven multidrug efflux pump
VGSIFVGANQLGVAIFKAVGLPKYAIISRALTLSLLAFCLSLLVPKYNIVGAAWAVVISNSITSLFTITYIAKTNGTKLSHIIFPKREDLKALKEGILKYHFKNSIRLRFYASITEKYPLDGKP